MSRRTPHSSFIGPLSLATALALTLTSCGSGSDQGANGGVTVDDMVPLAAAPDAFTPPEGAETATAQLEAMITALIENTTTDNRIVDAEILKVLDWKTEAGLPDLVLNTMSAAASLRAESYDIVASHLDVGAGAGYDAAATRWFQERATPARQFADRNLAALDIITRTRSLELPARRCFVDGDVTDRVCEGQTDAVALLGELDELARADVALPDDVSVYDESVDACAAWTSAVADQPADAVQRFEQSLPRSLLDTRFIGRSECRDLEFGDDEIEADTSAGTAAFTNLYATLTALAADQPTPDSIPRGATAEADPQVALNVAYLQAGSATAQDQLDGLIEPNARLAMLSIVIRSERELVKLQLLQDLGQADFEQAIYCAQRDQGSDWLADCDDAQRTLAEYALLDRLEPIARTTAVVDWGDIDKATGYCAVFNEQLDALPDDGSLFSNQTYYLRDLFGFDDC